MRSSFALLLFVAGCASQPSVDPNVLPDATASHGPVPTEHPGAAPSSTPVDPDSPDLGVGPQANPIKWNPGHYMASGGIVKPGSTIATSSFLPYELAALENHDAIVGYRIFIYWAALEPTKNNYDFSQIDEILTYLQTQLDKPKHLVIDVLPGTFNSMTLNGSVLPAYLLNDSAYGASPQPGSYGWWGGNGNGNTASACLFRPAVMDRWIALHQALGSQYDTDPYVEGIMFQEDSWVMGAWTTNKVPDYTGDAAMVTQFTKLLTSTVAAWPHTNVIFQNTWMGTVTPTQTFEQTMVDLRVAPSTADTFGQTYVDNHGGKLNSWGMDAYIGHTDANSAYTGPDLRPKIHAMVDVEGPDLGMYQNMGGTVGVGGYTVEDICNALNTSYGASHAFWTWLGDGSTIPATSRWSNLVTTVAAHPIVNTSYPVVYP